MVNNEVSSRPFINRNEENVMSAKRIRMLRRGRLYVSAPSRIWGSHGVQERDEAFYAPVGGAFFSLLYEQHGACV